MDQTDQFGGIFEHWSRYRVIYCRPCQFCPVPDQILTHLRIHHPFFSVDERRAIQTAILQLPHLARQPQEVVYPPPYEAPVQGLPIKHHGFRCTFNPQTAEDPPCQFVCGQLKHMKQHCCTVHGWQNQQRRGGDARLKSTQSPNRIWVDQVSCQQFFKYAQWKRYFAVTPSSEFSPPDEDDQVAAMIEVAKRRVDQYWKDRKKSLERSVLQALTHRYETNTWLRYTDWTTHLAGYTHDQLAELVQLPISLTLGQRVDISTQSIDPTLWQACLTTLRIVRLAQQACRAQVVGKAALHYINRRESGQASNERPLYAGQQGKTILKYAGHLCRILCYIWRTQQSEEVEPRYRLTDEQQHRLTRLQTTLQTVNHPIPPSQRPCVNQACLEWWISLLQHRLDDDPYQNALISGTAALGWNGIDGIWHNAITFSPALSGIITTYRMLVVYHAHQAHQTELEQVSQRGPVKPHHPPAVSSHYSRIQTFTDRWLTLTEFGGCPTPMDHLLRQRTYAAKIRMETGKDGQISWLEDEVQFGSIRLRMYELRTMVHGLVEQVQLQLYTELLLLQVDEQGQLRSEPTPLPPLDLRQLRDNPANRQGGWSFLDEPINQAYLGVDGPTWLHERVAREPALRHRFTRFPVDGSRGDFEWQPSAVHEYFQAVKRFKSRLLVLVHLTGGGPARGTEILTIQHRNSPVNGGRGVFIHHGLLHTVTTYHKGYAQTCRTKVVHRFLPSEVGKLWVYYLWLVQPFVEILQHHTTGQDQPGPWMWEPRAREGDVQTPEEEEEEMEENEDTDDDDGGDHDEESIINPDHRLDALIKTVETEDGTVEIPLHDHHSSHNVDGYWDSGRVRYVLQQATLAGMGVEVTIRAWRHIVKAIIRGYTQNRQIHAFLDETRHRLDGTQDDPHDRQFGHSSYVAGKVYGRDLTDAIEYTASERDQFYQVSLEWHRFLRFPSALGPRRYGSIVQELQEIPVSPQIYTDQQRRWKQVQQIDLRDPLRQLLQTPNATFRGQQEAILHAIVQRRSPIVTVMGTGGGKSLLFQIPAMMDRVGMTVVVVPLISLRQHLRDRCRQVGIRCHEWQAQHPPDGAQIVLVTPEGCSTEAFQHFLNRQRSLGTLDRIVVDECHIILDSVRGWRPQVRRLIELGQHCTQLLYLTATLPPHEEATFFHMTGIPRATVTMFRDRTTRANLQYQVQVYDQAAADTVIQELVAQKQAQYPCPGQIVVYGPSVAEVQRMGTTVLHCPIYHREVGTEAQKAQILQRFTEGAIPVIVTTNALGLGIDRGSVRVVIHVGVPRRIRDFAQESGRAGRDGHLGESIILQPGKKDPQGRLLPKVPQQAEQPMQKYLQPGRCRRSVLDQYLDGQIERISCLEEEERCDVCQARRGHRQQHPPQSVSPNPTSQQNDCSIYTDRSSSSDPEPPPSKRRCTKKTIKETPLGRGRDDRSFPLTPSRPPLSVLPQPSTRQRVPARPPAHPTDRLRSVGKNQARRDHSTLPTPSDQPSSDDDQSSRENSNNSDYGESSDHSTPITSPILSPQSDSVVDDLPGPIEMERLREVYRAKRRQEGQGGLHLEPQLEYWSRRCALCTVQGRPYAHPFDQCPSPQASQVRQRYHEVRHRVQYELYAACYMCGLPQIICEAWRDREGGRGGFARHYTIDHQLVRCQYPPQFHAAVVISVEEHGDQGILQMLQAIEECDEVLPENRGQLSWLQQRVRWGGMECSQLVRQFYRCAVVLEKIMVLRQPGEWERSP